MLDVKFVRQNPERIKKEIKERNISLKGNVTIDSFLDLDKEKQKLEIELDSYRAERNSINKTISGKPDDPTRKKLTKLKQNIAKLKPKWREVNKQWENAMNQFPNMHAEDTPIGKDESANKAIKKVGDLPKFDFKPKEHWELGKKLDIIDNERAAKVVGSRFTYLKGDLALLQFALIQHALSVLTDQKVLEKIIKKAKLNLPPTPFIPIIPPVLIRPEIMQKMDRLEPKEERYHTAQDDLYLIGSAEHTLGPMHMNETFDESKLPLRYVGYSTSFRREAGSYGKDVKGIFRVHQFDKLEMETFSLAEKSLEEQALMIAIQEHLVKSLELAYQIVIISTGDMGKPDYRQIDIETWLPGQNKYRETHTADLMNDFQSRRLGIRVISFFLWF
ncbi:MAG TPA: serine--tRNA ligase [bacterium]|nr:serine--tRNA ligase [bacterium]